MDDYNLILDTDSYKQSMYLQYPSNTCKVFSYIESRGGIYPETVFFGLSMFIKKYLSKPVTMGHVEEAKEICAEHGEPFNYDGWKQVVEKHKGFLPLAIKAVPEGSVIPTHKALVSVVNTDPELASDPDFYWVTTPIETSLLRGIWYPTHIATLSHRIRQLCLRYLEETGTPAGIDYMLNDFGGRGVSSRESAEIGGVAHLLSFKGTDNLPAIMAARKWYNCRMAGNSIPAAEHSTITAWGRPHEREAYLNMISRFAGKNHDGTGKMYATVSDSYDIFNAVENIWGGSLRSRVEIAGGTLVVRPDSGHPATVCLKVVEILWAKFGGTVNTKGFKVLAPCVRIIQGDGINETSIGEILETFKKHGYSADNIVFGMGGALLQSANRDDLKWAMKCSAVNVGGVWRDVFKDPITDPGKVSKKGVLETFLINGKYETVNTLEYSEIPKEWEQVMKYYYFNGPVEGSFDTLDQIRVRLNG